MFFASARSVWVCKYVIFNFFEFEQNERKKSILLIINLFSIMDYISNIVHLGIYCCWLKGSTLVTCIGFIVIRRIFASLSQGLKIDGTICIFLCRETNEIGNFEALETCGRLTILLANTPSSKIMTLQKIFLEQYSWDLVLTICNQL